MPSHKTPSLIAAILATVTLSAPGDMMEDSPVKFPEKGALPSRFPPDLKVESQPAEKDYYIFASPCRSLDQIAAIRGEMPVGDFRKPATDWSHLKRTRKILTEGGKLHVLGLGDSIVNDTMRSAWLAKLAEAHPKAEIRGTVYVRGGGGCQHYREDGRVRKYAIPLRPDLVFIGGISQRDVDSIREVIHQLRAGLPAVEILLATGTFGSTDPRDAEALAAARHSGTGAYGQSLKQLAKEEQCAFLDMTTPWAEFIRSTGKHPHVFYRDRVHANPQGEQILARILVEFFRSDPEGRNKDG